MDTDEANRLIQEFWSNPRYPNAKRYSEKMQEYLRSGLAENLDQAYFLADRAFNHTPPPVPPPIYLAPSPMRAPDPEPTMFHRFAIFCGGLVAAIMSIVFYNEIPAHDFTDAVKHIAIGGGCTYLVLAALAWVFGGLWKKR